MKNAIFRGCGTAIATPFKNNEVNYSALKSFLEFQISNRVDAIVVCGTTGEAATLSNAERKAVIEFTVNVVGGRIPVIAGTGSNNTQEAILNTQQAEKLGVDAALVVTPYYNKSTQMGLVRHYSKIAESTKLPIIMYNVPSRTGVNILPETCLELSKIENIVGIKEASGNISQVAKIIELCKENLAVYSGNDDQIVPMLSLGAKGVISVLSNVLPRYTHEMVFDFFEGRADEAGAKQLKALELIEALFSEVNPIPVKEALNIIGFEFGEPRLPLTRMTNTNREIMQSALQKML